MGSSGKPPEVVLATVIEKDSSHVILVGKTVSDGEPVKLILLGNSNYFADGDRFKITFDPLSTAVEPPPSGPPLEGHCSTSS